MKVILDILKWYLVLTGIGVIGFPIAFTFLKNLPGRGFVFARPLGLILISFIYWLFGTLGLLRVDIGSLICAVLAAAVPAAVVWIKHRDEAAEYLRTARIYLIVSEAVFLAAFLLIISFRLGGPEVSGTEKPMELMFINSILKSETFPPLDGWLSGYSISYYYFGYIMSAVLVLLSGVLSSVGFNLMLASVFAMAAAGAFGIVNDLLILRKDPGTQKPAVKISSILAPVFVLIAGNLEGFLEVLHSLHIFWKPDGTSGFWSVVGLKELTDAPTRPVTWDPTGRSGIWWWRASRVVGDTGLQGSVKEVIDEFPMFSFELGDLHPHVLAIPFVLFAVGIALNALFKNLQLRQQGPYFTEGVLRDDLSLTDTRMVKWICSADFWLTAVSIGALLFINTWDFPFYFGLYCLCVTAAHIRNFGWDRSGFAVFFETAMPLGIACILLYILFFMGFSSQAGGIAPSGVFVTNPLQFLIMFGFFLVPVLVWQVRNTRNCGNTAGGFGFMAALIIFLALTVLECLIFVVLIAAAGRNSGGALAMAADAFISMQEISTPQQGITGFLLRRLGALPTLLILFLAAGMSFTLIRGIDRRAETEPENAGTHPADVFCALMILIASALVIFPEFFYLRDLFGTRMNTIFKFYYQAWILFGLSAAYACSRLAAELRGAGRAVFAFVMTLLTAAVMVYPFFCAAGKWESLSGKQDLTLDGAAFLRMSRPDEWNCLQFLNEAELGVVLEKVGSSYGSDNIVSTFVGLPAVLGPVGHESQWHGGYSEIGSRNDDVRILYETHSWDTAKKLLDTYDIRYVFIGNAEKNAYNIQEKKFERNLNKVFSSGSCAVYQVY